MINYKHEDIIIDEIDINTVKEKFCYFYNIDNNDTTHLEKEIKIILKSPENFNTFIKYAKIDTFLFLKFAFSISIKIFNKRMIDFIRKNYSIKI